MHVAEQVSETTCALSVERLAQVAIDMAAMETKLEVAERLRAAAETQSNAMSTEIAAMRRTIEVCRLSVNG